jgi:hypothetical protein
MSEKAQEKKDLHEVEELLRNGRLPDSDLPRVRHKVWQQVLAAQRKRRKAKTLLRLPPWIWALASITVILIGIIVIFFLD